MTLTGFYSAFLPDRSRWRVPVFVWFCGVAFLKLLPANGGTDVSTKPCDLQLRLTDESDASFLARAEQVAKIARVLIDACLQNECVRVLLNEPELPFYTEEYFRESPVVQIDYEEAYAIASFDEGLSVTRRKRWGEGPWILPLPIDEYVDPYFITYCYKPNSKRRQRFEQRQRLRELLGRKHRALVKLAQRNTKTRFLERLDEAGAFAIVSRLRVDPGTFWRAAKGTTFPALPLKAKQLVLFEK